MSGAELTSAITEEMGGRWRPKPGSMYPLLRSLLQDGLTQEVPVEDGRTRRYELTAAGLKFLETQVDRSGELLEKIDPGFTSPPFPFHPIPELRPVFQNLFMTLRRMGVVLQSNTSPEVLKEIAQAVEQFTDELERITNSIQD